LIANPPITKITTTPITEQITIATNDPIDNPLLLITSFLS
jgi:hypothetical protein